MDAKKSRFTTGVRAPLVGVVLTALSAFLAIGLVSFAAPCAETAGAPHACHVVRRVLLAMDAVLGVISVVRIFELDEGERRGLSFSAALVGQLIASTPVWIMPLCADTTMRCTMVMLPFVTGVGVAAALVGGADLVRRLLAIGH